MTNTIVDSHQHFWRPGKFDYPWMSPEVTVLYRDYLPADLAPMLKTCGVNSTVLVQASNSLEETRWLLDLAADHSFIAGVVGWVDLASADVGAQLEDFARHPKFKGVRHLIESEPADDWMIQPRVLEGFDVLSSRSFTYDMLVYTRHLKFVELVAERYPRLSIVIDHLAKPPIRSREFDEWAVAIKSVSLIPNVSCKLSGLVTEADHGKWETEDLKPYVDHVLECFGSQRLIFGSDYPVCLLAASYERVIDSFQDLLKDLKPDQLEAVFGGNARRFYKL